MSRPELSGDAALFYGEREARKYDSSSRMAGVQRDITERAVELLRLDPSVPSLVLDVGCGSGLSGRVLEERGHVWVGCDVSRDMLAIAKGRQRRRPRKGGGGGDSNDGGEDEEDSDDEDEEDSDDDDDDDDEEEEEEEEEMEEENEEGSGGGPARAKPAAKRAAAPPSARSADGPGDLLLHDMGCGLPFRPATFDACVSVSALQWLCYSNAAGRSPRRRLARFFSSLYSVLRRGGRAVLQFYPETAEQSVLIAESAARVGFAGGVVVDYPNSAKAKKHYLVLSFDKGSGQRAQAAAAGAIDGGGGGEPGAPPQHRRHVGVASSPAPPPAGGRRGGKPRPPARKDRGAKTKEWILRKKESQRRRGREVRPDSKYTARRRPRKF
jgi:18S rRNA (guanine1575-N7)-methyltransferase